MRVGSTEIKLRALAQAQSGGASELRLGCGRANYQGRGRVEMVVVLGNWDDGAGRGTAGSYLRLEHKM